MATGTSFSDVFSTNESEDDSDWEYSGDSSIESSDEDYSDVDSEKSSDDEPLSKLQRIARPKPTKKAAAEMLQTRWKEGDFQPKVFPFVIPPSSSGLNPHLGISDKPTEFELFKLMFDRDVLEHLVAETNKYYVYLLDHTDVKEQSKLHRWVDVDVDEMYLFLSIVMLMSLQKKQHMKHYWSTDPLIHTPMFGSLMSSNRFFLILRTLHFSDNNEQVPGDRLFKIRPILEKLKQSFGIAFYPYQDLVIDESLMLWKGRLSFKQFIPSKRHRFGIKLFILCDCKTGFIVDFIVYTGATTEIIPTEGDMGISGAIVLTLMDRFLRRGHTLYTDNWYTSPALAEKLHSEETGTCGTVKANRKGMPVFPSKMKKGERVEKHTANMLAVKWHDRRDVHMLSTVNEPGESVTGKKDRTTKEDIRKPTCVINYNKNMGGIDKSDMQLSFVECVRKSVKWSKKLFFHLLDMSTLNAYILYKQCHGIKSLEFSEFRLELIRQMVQECHKPRKSAKGGRTSQAENPLRLTERHFPSVVPPTEKKAGPSRVCRVCSQTTQGPQKRRESRYQCQICDVGLCVAPCFETFHTKLNF